MVSYMDNGIVMSPKSKRASVAGERALDWLKAVTCATQAELAKVVADELDETFLYVQKAISNWFRSAGGEWTHVHLQPALNADGHKVQQLYYDGSIARLPECRGATRWRFDYTVQVVIQHLRANRGVAFTTPELAEAVGYPSGPRSLQTALHARRATLTKRGVVITPGTGKSYTAYMLPAPKNVQVPVAADGSIDSLVSAGEPFLTPIERRYMANARPVEEQPVAERFASGHAEAIKSLERDGWLEPVGRASNGDALYRTADGVIGRFQPL